MDHTGVLNKYEFLIRLGCEGKREVGQSLTDITWDTLHCARLPVSSNEYPDFHTVKDRSFRPTRSCPCTLFQTRRYILNAHGLSQTTNPSSRLWRSPVRRWSTKDWPG
jgi:hypothetical protein